MRMDIWSDVICPWCYIGKRRLEAALDDFEHADRVTVVWRAFQLDPSLAAQPGPSAVEVMAGPGGDHARVRARFAEISRIGAEDGLELRLGSAHPVNTFDAHRLSAWARELDQQDAMVERLLHGYHTRNLNIADHTVLADLASEAGLDRDEALGVLGEGRYTDDVRTDLAEARTVGARGVPTFALNGRKFHHGPPEVGPLVRLLRTAAASAPA
ncbi:DsbA family oxidoreductase [Nocardiopsis halotolerans]|uniref:DsbA family oxidoreductase n=1 Tax=Nocardiopsis halotolerans TaxID=124252 RepID=UPI00034871C1|nr:DsbA family oxidoreductase [Nocardiopsis halotolerans]